MQIWDARTSARAPFASAQYTVKRYTSRKAEIGEDEWRHTAIRLEPLNPDYPPLGLAPDQFYVLGEFVQVL